MFETSFAIRADATATPTAYRGPERRAGTAPIARWAALMLDKIDYGMVLLSGDGDVIHMNHAAHADLDERHPLQLLGTRLRARHAVDVARLYDALAGAAQRGLYRLLAIGQAEQRVSISVLPLGNHATLLMLGKRQLSERLSVQGFARLHGLTPAETRVLELLCDGLDPRRIAAQNTVGLATVRTQIGSIRAKTGADNIRHLVRQVAVLPPMVSALRG